MALRVVRLGSPRAPDEGLRLGTVRRPPRGVPKARFAADDWYDLWLPLLSPSAETLKFGQAAGRQGQWTLFSRRYRAEMAEPGPRQMIGLLAALSHQAGISIGCYCADEARCHRSLLAQMLAEAGAELG